MQVGIEGRNYLKRWLHILEVREEELQEFTEKAYVRNGPDYWFYLDTLRDNRRLQEVANMKLYRKH